MPLARVRAQVGVPEVPDRGFRPPRPGHDGRHRAAASTRWTEASASPDAPSAATTCVTPGPAATATHRPRARSAHPRPEAAGDRPAPAETESARCALSQRVRHRAVPATVLGHHAQLDQRADRPVRAQDRVGELEQRVRPRAVQDLSGEFLDRRQRVGCSHSMAVSCERLALYHAPGALCYRGNAGRAPRSTCYWPGA